MDAYRYPRIVCTLYSEMKNGVENKLDYFKVVPIEV